MPLHPILRHFLAVLLLLQAAPRTSCGQYPKSSLAVTDSELRVAIRTFTYGGLEYLKVLHRSPSRAAALLVAGLHPIPRGGYSDAPDVVWFIRALRSLTGLDFRGRTDSALSNGGENDGGGEAWFLRPDTLGTVEFFGTWMSREFSWVAPRDAQVRIIEQWHQWYRHEAATFHYVKDDGMGNWYW
jgi:hypothetical protein